MIVFLWFFEFVGGIILFTEGLFLLVIQYNLAQGVPGASDIPVFILMVMLLITAGILGFLSW
ncbi:hypothetical protein JXM67_14190 [candidate division WOR-3 bacterium]|nr:hypothetical protein [candidate division WOR-3 bacterium]